MAGKKIFGIRIMHVDPPMAPGKRYGKQSVKRWEPVLKPGSLKKALEEKAALAREQNQLERRLKTFKTAALVLMLGAVLVTSAAAVPAPVASIPSNYKLAYDEEFNEPDINQNISPYGPIGGQIKYIAHTPYGGDFGCQTWQNPYIDGYPFSTQTGGTEGTPYFYIRGWHDSGGDHAGMISSCDRQGNGFSAAKAYWEAKIWWPVPNPHVSNGLWPAFWLDAVNELGSTSDHSLGAEIDIAECYSNAYPNGQYQIATHEAANHPYIFTQAFTGVDLSAGWHVYSCLIDDTTVHFYFDGKEMASGPANPQDQVPLYFMLDFAFCGGWPEQQNWGTDPGNGTAWSNQPQMRVQYVRVWTPSNTPLAPVLHFNP